MPVSIRAADRAVIFSVEESFQITASDIDKPIVSLDDIIISSELMLRPLRKVNTGAETAAMQSLAMLLSAGRRAVFKGLAELAVKLCDAGSAGISVQESVPSGDHVFRWQALAGVVEPYEGGESPRDWSPCGTCLELGKPTLYSHPERHFTYLQKLGIPIVEGLVIPMGATTRATIWILSHEECRRFDAEDVRVMVSLSGFAAIGLSLSVAAVVQPVQVDPTATRENIWEIYVRQVAHGHHAGLTALYRETSPLVFATALRIVGFPADAEEVTADVYARIWRAARSYDSERGSVATWLRTIARSLAFDRLRSSALRARCEVELRLDYRSAIDLERDLIAGQAQERVLAALQALPVEQRQVIELAYLAGLKCPEIAERLEEPVGTVKTRLRLGLIKLRRLLGAVG